VSHTFEAGLCPSCHPVPLKTTVEEVHKNVEAMIEGLGEVLVGLGSVTHVVMMFDEVATEKRIRWDPKTNFFIGACTRHQWSSLA